MAAWRFGDWRHWEQYYPTLLFISLVNFIYNLLCYNYPLWEYESPLLKTTGSDVFINLTGMPAMTLLFLTGLTRLMEGRRVLIPLYTLGWIACLTSVEWLSYRLGLFSYNHGWTIWWSVLFNFVMFPTMWLHYKRPLLAIGLSVIFAAFLLTYFDVPFSSMK